MRYVNSSYEKALTYLLRYVNVLKKTMRKTLITNNVRFFNVPTVLFTRP